MESKWMIWAKRLQALAQNGLTFNPNPFDIQRYEKIREIAAEIMANGHPPLAGQFGDLFTRQDGYATPKVDVRAAVFRDGRILLVREILDGCWSLPGGWADVCESSSESVVREVFEESGFLTRTLKLLAVYDRSKHPHEPQFPFHVYKLFYQCEIIGGEPRQSNETSDVAFFPCDGLPELSRSRVTADQIQRMFDHAAHPDWPTDYD